MLLGESGVGKSSTVNHLLNREVAAMSDRESETRSTTEHILKGSDTQLAATDMSLSVVDAPGFNDTDGLEQDARNLMSIEGFYKKHPSLMGKAYPNIILVAILSTDTRFQGKQSRFMKCLRAIQRLKLVDRMNPNVVVVITRACAIANKHMKEKKVLLKEVISKTLHVNAPVICLENAPTDHGLEQIGDYTRLPDGSLQPKNLFEAMIQVAKEAGDEFAQHCFSTFFSPESTSYDIKVGLTVQANLSGLTHAEREIFGNLKEDLTSQEFVPEVVQLINSYLQNRASSVPKVCFLTYLQLLQILKV